VTVKLARIIFTLAIVIFLTTCGRSNDFPLELTSCEIKLHKKSNNYLSINWELPGTADFKEIESEFYVYVSYLPILNDKKILDIEEVWAPLSTVEIKSNSLSFDQNRIMLDGTIKADITVNTYSELILIKSNKMNYLAPYRIENLEPNTRYFINVVGINNQDKVKYCMASYETLL